MRAFFPFQPESMPREKVGPGHSSRDRGPAGQNRPKSIIPASTFEAPTFDPLGSRPSICLDHSRDPIYPTIRVQPTLDLPPVLATPQPVPRARPSLNGSVHLLCACLVSRPVLISAWAILGCLGAVGRLLWSGLGCFGPSGGCLWPSRTIRAARSAAR